MADDFGSMEIYGLEELEAKLAEMDNDMAGKALYGALNFASSPMVKEAKQRAPATEQAYRRYMSSGQGEATYTTTLLGKKRKGKSKKAKRGEGKFEVQQPGTLRRSIRRQRLRKIREFNEGGAAVGIFIKNKRSDLPPYYWYFVEYGTSKMPAVPFLRPAFDNNVDLAVDRFKTKLAANIEKYTE